MANYENNKNNNSVNMRNYDVALIAHSARGNLVVGIADYNMPAKPKKIISKVTPVANGQGQNSIAILDGINTYAIQAMKKGIIAENTRVLIVGNNNLCAKVRTILKMAKSAPEDIVNYLTKSLPKVNADYRKALSDFVQIIQAMSDKCKIAACDVYSYPIDRFNLVPTKANEERTIPEGAAGKKFVIENGIFTDEEMAQLWSSDIDISGEFELIVSGNNCSLKKDYLTSSMVFLNNTFNDIVNRIPKEVEVEEISCEDFFAD